MTDLSSDSEEDSSNMIPFNCFLYWKVMLRGPFRLRQKPWVKRSYPCRIICQCHHLVFLEISLQHLQLEKFQFWKSWRVNYIRFQSCNNHKFGMWSMNSDEHKLSALNLQHYSYCWGYCCLTDFSHGIWDMALWASSLYHPEQHDLNVWNLKIIGKI